MLPVQDGGHFYLLSSSKNYLKNDYYMDSSWALKRISSTSGGGNKGSVNTNFNIALAKGESQPGESEVLWIQPEVGGRVLSLVISRDTRLEAPSRVLLHSLASRKHIMEAQPYTSLVTGHT